MIFPIKASTNWFPRIRWKQVCLVFVCKFNLVSILVNHVVLPTSSHDRIQYTVGLVIKHDFKYLYFLKNISHQIIVMLPNEIMRL